MPFFLLRGGCRSQWVVGKTHRDMKKLPGRKPWFRRNWRRSRDDIFPDLRMRLKRDKKSGKVMYGADIQSVFDIFWYTFSRMVADIAPPVDEDLNYFESQGYFSLGVTQTNSFQPCAHLTFSAFHTVAGFLPAW
jgi:hypothetical protein